MSLERSQLLALGLSDAFLDIADEWKEAIQTMNFNNQSHQGAVVVSAVMYKHGDEWRKYALLENGQVFSITSESVEDGQTWNGDDVYVNAFKTIFTFHDKIGEVEFHDCDYNNDENIENIACQVVEILRDMKI